MELLTGFKWGYSGEEQQMLIDRGRVVERTAQIEAGPEIPRRDLRGQWILPSFVDAHCHILPTGLDLLKLHLGGAECHADVLDLVRDARRRQPEGWLRAVQYDQNRYSGVHLTCHDLDSISPSEPILLCHVNHHASVANTAALRTLGISDSSPDPAGGVYGRDASGRLTGLLLEAAHDQAISAHQPTKNQMVEAILRAGELMASQEISCASDLMTGFFSLEDELDAYTQAAAAGSPIRTRLYVQWADVFGPTAAPDALERVRQLTRPDPNIGVGSSKDVKVAGIKLFADGAISSGTAAIYGRFEASKGLQDSEKPGTDGKLIHTPERLKEMVKTAEDAGFAVSIHSIGDFSTDVVLDALESTAEPSRHRVEHVMLLNDGQIERLARLGVRCTMQPEFLAKLGKSYRRQLGDARASQLIRARSALDGGVSLSFSSDRPIVAGDPRDGILAASNRPDGYDPSENCTVEEAIRAYTEAGAVANGEPGLMGTLGPGSLADYQTFADDPMQEFRTITKSY